MSDAFTVCALYHFVTIEDCDALAAEIKSTLDELEIRGTILVAREGINGTIAGSRESMSIFEEFLRSDPRLTAIRFKESMSDEMPFNRTRVKLKNEIVTMGVPDIDPTSIVGTYVKPGDWNRLISDPDVTVIDTRNEYEVQIGTFTGAVNPHTETFREFPDYVASNLDPSVHKKVAMFCTGGIRCEKSTAYLKSQGFDEVYHLEGGILKYLEEIPAGESLWQGECFVFDDRVTVDHNLDPGSYDQCHACRMPITEEDKLKDAFVPGVSCHHCIDGKTDDDRMRFREREKQIRLAEARGETHIGSDARLAQARQAERKRKRKQSQRQDNQNR